MPNKPLSMKEKKEMANALGTGGANKAAKAIIKRHEQNEEAAESPSAQLKRSEGVSVKQGPTIDMSNPKAYQEYQMQQAIEEVRKKKTAKASSYQ